MKRWTEQQNLSKHNNGMTENEDVVDKIKAQPKNI